MLNLIIALFVGLSIGSFANVCIYRIPLDLSVRLPKRSFCPWCKSQLKWYHNIPILSFVFQKGRCSFCEAPISFRYLLVELTIPTLWMGILLSIPPVSVMESLFVGMTIFTAVIITFVDLDWRLIPDKLSLSWLVVAILSAPLNPLFQGLVWSEAYVRSLSGAISAAVLVWVVLSVGRLIKQRDVMGWGDVKLMACWGAVLGVNAGVVVFFTGAFLATIWILSCLLYKPLRSNDFLPFGPFLNLAGLIIFWRQLISPFLE